MMKVYDFAVLYLLVYPAKDVNSNYFFLTSNFSPFTNLIDVFISGCFQIKCSLLMIAYSFIVVHYWYALHCNHFYLFLVREFRAVS